MRDIVYYGLINATVIASAICQHRAIGRLRFGSAGCSLAAEFKPLHADLRSLHAKFAPMRADLRSLRDDIMEKLDSIQREMQAHIAACQRGRLTNREHKN